jgi:2-amino-4-hydroxy-6-hydroxymethyldihydropteridine diphosphokinase
MSRTFVALGGNARGIAFAIRALAQARAALEAGPARVVAASSLWRTPAYPPGSGPDYANAVLALEGAGPPGRLLARLHMLERAAGRGRQRRWGTRPLDLDLLDAGRIVPDRQAVAAWMALPGAAQRLRAPRTLLLPHPRLHERAFVLAPLAEIAPLWRHPLTGATAAEMLAAIPAADRAGLRRIPAPWGPPRPG